MFNLNDKFRFNIGVAFLVLAFIIYSGIPPVSIGYQISPVNTAVTRSFSRSKTSDMAGTMKRRESSCQRVTIRKGSDDEPSIENDYFRQLGYKNIIKDKKENTFIGPAGESSQSMASLAKYFIPGFVAIWAAGYGAIFLAEISGNGLGDSGGFIGAGLAVFLLFALVGVAGYEVFKPLPSENSF